MYAKLQSIAATLPKNIIGPGFQLLVIKVAGAVLAYAMMVSLARFLSEEEYGYFGLSFNLSLVLASLCAFGLPQAIMRFWPEYMDAKKTGLANGIALSSFHLIALGSVAAVTLGAILSYAGVGQSTLGFRDAPLAIAIFAATIALSDFNTGLMRAQGEVTWALAPRDVVWRVLVPTLALALVGMNVHFDARLAIYCCVVVLLLLSLLQISNRIRPTLAATSGAQTQKDWPGWRKRLVPLWAASLLLVMVQQLDVVIVGSMVNAAEAGAYFAAQKTASLLGLAMIAGGLAGAPLMAAHFHGGRLKEIQRICSTISIATALTTLAGFLFLAVFGRHLLALFDPAYVGAHGIMLILAAGFMIDSLAGPNAYLLQMTSLESAYLKIMGFTYFLVVVAQIILVPIHGSIGAAVASASGVVIWNVLAIWLLRKRHRLDPSILGLIWNPQRGEA